MNFLTSEFYKYTHFFLLFSPNLQKHFISDKVLVVVPEVWQPLPVFIFCPVWFFISFDDFNLQYCLPAISMLFGTESNFRSAEQMCSSIDHINFFVSFNPGDASVIPYPDKQSAAIGIGKRS